MPAKIYINYKETGVKDEEKLRKAMKKFKKLCEVEGIIRDARRKTYYEKPSDVRRRKRKITNKQKDLL